VIVGQEMNIFNIKKSSKGMRVSFICINNLAKAAVSHISVGLGRVDTFHQLATHLTAKSFSLFP